MHQVENHVVKVTLPPRPPLVKPKREKGIRKKKEERYVVNHVVNYVVHHLALAKMSY